MHCRRIGDDRRVVSGLVLALPRAMLDARMESVARDVAAAAEGPGGGVRVVRVDRPLSAETIRCITQMAARLGFLCHQPGQSVSPNNRIELVHRHLFLLCASAGDYASIVPWIRDLCWTSPRRHVVLWPAEGSAALRAASDGGGATRATGSVGGPE